VDNVIDLVYALKSPYRRNAVFLMKDVTVSALRKLKDSNGVYLWQPSVQQVSPTGSWAIRFTPRLMYQALKQAHCRLLLATSPITGLLTAWAEAFRDSTSFMPETVSRFPRHRTCGWQGHSGRRHPAASDGRSLISRR
jgi:hypothetical protein